MSETLIRDYSPEELPDMSALWQRVFGDSPKTVDGMLAALPDIGGAVVAVTEGRLVGAAYALTGMELLDAGYKKAPILGYIYAVGVDSEFRRRGLGGELTKAAAELARRREADIICVQPASEELFGWYEKLLNVKCVLRRSEQRLDCAALTPTMALSSTEYMLWREQMLRGKPHVHHSNHSLEAQKQLLESCGGGFFAAASGIAAVSRDGDEAVISELICMDKRDRKDIAASVGAAVKAKTLTLRQADPSGAPYMAADRAIPETSIWNLSFD